MIYTTLKRARDAIIAEYPSDFGKINCFISTEQKPVTQMHGTYCILSPSGSLQTQFDGELKLANVYDFAFGLYHTSAIDELGKYEYIVKQLTEKALAIQKVLHGYYLDGVYMTPIKLEIQQDVRAVNDGARWTYFLVQKYMVEAYPIEWTDYKSGMIQKVSGFDYDYLNE